MTSLVVFNKQDNLESGDAGNVCVCEEAGERSSRREGLVVMSGMESMDRYHDTANVWKPHV